MRKKALSLALALIMALSLLPTTAIAADPDPSYTVSGYGPNGEPFETITKMFSL